VLPDEPEIPNRDKLADEKELTGAYFSDNPLMRLARRPSPRVTHFANQLDESLARHSITLAGVVTSVRVHTTKKGEPMAFVSLEDPTGAVELTVFPKVFERTREVWRNDTVVLVKGKAEFRNGKIQVLCDSAEEYQLLTDDEPATDTASSPNRGQPSAVQYAMPEEEEAAIAEMDPFADEEMFVPPPPPEPDDRQQTTDTREPRVEVGGQDTTGGNGGSASAVSPMRVAEAPTRYQPARHLRIFLTRTNDYDEDVRRMRELLALLSSVDGHDRFTFYVPNPQGIVQLDFPNHSTSYAQVQGTLDELMSEWGTIEVQ